jgi:hypothetical protein
MNGRGRGARASRGRWRSRFADHANGSRAWDVQALKISSSRASSQRPGMRDVSTPLGAGGVVLSIQGDIGTSADSA